MSEKDIPLEVRQYMSKLGRKGGAKGGKARAANLTDEELSKQGRAAVNVRWAKARRKKAKQRKGA